MDLGIGVEGLRRRLPDLSALGGLYDHLGFGPFLRRQGEAASTSASALADQSAPASALP